MGFLHYYLYALLCYTLAMAIISNPSQIGSDLAFLFMNSQLLVYKQDELTLPDVSVLQHFFDNHFVEDCLYENNYDYTVACLKSDCSIPNDCCFTPLRSVYAAEVPFAPLAARASALLNWKAKTRFCSYCGSSMSDASDETALDCTKCGRRVYPSLNPAIIVQVYKGEKLLLARHAKRNTEMYTCLAGYVEPGESLEDCVRREVKEETAIEVTNIRYFESQSWPFPDQLMLGFTAEWKSGIIEVQKEEIDEAQWFNKDSLPTIPKSGSLAYKLITNSYKIGM